MAPDGLTPPEPFYTLRLPCPPGAAPATVPAPSTIAICRCGLLTFFQVTGPCFTPAGTKSAEVLSKTSGSPPTTNSISPPRSSGWRDHSRCAEQPRCVYHGSGQKYEGSARAFRTPSRFQEIGCSRAQVHYSSMSWWDIAGL